MPGGTDIVGIFGGAGHLGIAIHKRRISMMSKGNGVSRPPEPARGIVQLNLNQGYRSR